MGSSVPTEDPASTAAADTLPDWSLLPPDLIVSIAEHLHFTQLSGLRAVCVRWARALSGLRPSTVPVKNSTPWLLLPSEIGEYSEHCSFLDLSDGITVHRISPLPKIRGRRCVGSSSDGWLVTVDRKLNADILNPFTREQFPLPSLLTIPDQVVLVRDPDGTYWFFDGECEEEWKYRPMEGFRDSYIRKIYLTSAPPHGIAAAITGFYDFETRLSFARIGDRSWSPGLSSVVDMIYDEESNRFYAFNFDQSVSVFDLDNYDWDHPSPLQHAILVRGGVEIKQDTYLCLLNGDLLKIVRDSIYAIEEDDHYLHHQSEEEDDEEFKSLIVSIETHEFVVTKLHRFLGENQKSCWVPVDDLGDFSIFLGCNHTIAINVAGKPGLRRNCVYFTEEPVFYWFANPSKVRRHARDVGMYDLTRRKVIHKYFPLNCKVNWPPPVWFMPPKIAYKHLSDIKIL